MISNPFLPRAIPAAAPIAPSSEMSAAGSTPTGGLNQSSSGTRNLSSESTGSTDSAGSFKRFNFYTDDEIRKMCTDGEPNRLRKILPEYFTEEKKANLIGWMDQKLSDIEGWLKEKRNSHPRKQATLQQRYDNIVICHHYVSNLGKRSVSVEK
jgi:hypothetical protein